MKTKPLIVANWKMNLLPSQEADLAQKYAQAFTRLAKKVEIVICPTHTGLAGVAEQLRGSALVLGAQDVSGEMVGAFTGEVSAAMLKELGVTHCIVGHSERRQRVHETDEMVNAKTRAVLVEGMIPIVCVGESYEERLNGQKEVMVLQRLTAAMKNVSGERPVVITYEPIWAISPGGPASPAEVEPMVSLIRQTLRDLFPAELVEKNFRIIYGGSVEGDNIKDFLGLEYVEGALVGAASLLTARFTKIIQSASKL